MSSIAPSSTRSFRSTACAGQFSIPRTKSSLSNLNSNIRSVIDEAEYEATMKTTMRLVRSPCHGTARNHSQPPLRLATPVSMPNVNRGGTPSTPVSGRYVNKQSAPSTPNNRQYFKKETTPFSPPASPTKGAQRNFVCTCLTQRSSPPPSPLFQPSTIDTLSPWLPTAATEFVMTRLDVLACIRGIPNPAQMSRPTYAQAFAEYSKQYHTGHVEIVLLPGSMWAKAAVACFDDEFSDFEYSAEDEVGVHEAEVYAEAEKAYQAVLMEAENTYQAVLKAHGFA
ncbi:uncharacterized protein ARMOST_15513 [Armillaria ostoyae]|uniref:Uncharacterized protein n=1 Tax=Armillaria ostoyae TaxID=47428 RepID=A0A284RTQ4_ARMOS|nr:uncharacterized protein ARMOST_15513 [Armillaria ostoyae]